MYSSTLHRAASFSQLKHLDSSNPAETEAYVKEFIGSVVLPEMESLVSKSLHKMSLNAPHGASDAEAFTDHYAIDRVQGIYMKLVVYQDEAALGDQVMKSDHWEGIHRLPTPQLFEGVPNFRKVDCLYPSFGLFGVAQPTLRGLEDVLNLLEGQYGYKHTVWINLREEPIVYVNGLPFAPRDKETLNINLDHLLGIDGLDLEAMEGRLKADILTVTQQKLGRFPFYFQTAAMSNESREITVLPGQGAVRTLRDVYSSLRLENHFNIDYYRIPITDECAPEEKDFDILVNALRELGSETAVVFNCQMGRGRTTTGLVCAYLLKQAKKGDWKPIKDVVFPDPKAPNLDNGEYQVILKLIATLPDGELIKCQVDEAIDACSAMQNLRMAISECKRKGDVSAEGRTPEFWEKRGLLYLERYWWLILFNSYLRKQAPKFGKSFSEWMKNKWGLRRLLRKLDLS